MHNYSCFFGFIGREPEMTRHEGAEESHGSLLIERVKGLFIGREPGMKSARLVAVTAPEKHTL